MVKFKRILADVHLYNDRVEYILKLAGWLLSWSVGLFILRLRTQEAGSAYFVYSISLLMEFLGQINKKEEGWGQVVHTLFCAVIIMVAFLSAMIIFVPGYNQNYHSIIYWAVKGILTFMIIDCITFCCTPRDKAANNSGRLTEEAIAALLSQYNQNLSGGNLGNFGKEQSNV